MRKSCVFLITLIIFFVPKASAAEQSVTAFESSPLHGCILRSPSNLLVNLKSDNLGQVLSFSDELGSITKKTASLKRTLRKLKDNKTPKTRKKIRKLRKRISNLNLLKSEVEACREGSLAPSVLTLVVCSDDPVVSEGIPCDDGNPCTTDDRCIAGLCSGTVTKGGNTLSCSFGDCAVVVAQCSSGQFIACFPGAASDEICNSVDDDCNGAVDEGEICAAASPTPGLTPTKIQTATPVQLPTDTPSAQPTAIPTAIPTITPTFTVTRTATATPTRTVTRTSTRTPTRTATLTPTPTPILFCPIEDNNIKLGAAGCPCGSANDCGGGCGSNVCNSSGCPLPGNSLAVSPANCPCFGNADCLTGICRASSDGLCGPPTSLSISCAVTDNNIRANFPGCGCTDNTDCLSPMSCTTISGSAAKYCSGGGVVCTNPANTSGLNPKNCPCNSNAACESNSCAAASASFASACR